jgi:hypothetical protein
MEQIYVSHARVMANTLFMSCKDGASLNDKFESPTSGYMVGGFGKEMIFDSIALVKVSKIEEWVESHKLKRDEYYGVWYDKGKVYFDVSKNIRLRFDAIRLGKVKKQIAIFEVKTGKDITL